MQSQCVRVFTRYPRHIAVDDNGKAAAQGLGQGDEVMGPQSYRVAGRYESRRTVAVEADDSTLQVAV